MRGGRRPSCYVYEDLAMVDASYAIRETDLSGVGRPSCSVFVKICQWYTRHMIFVKRIFQVWGGHRAAYPGDLRDLLRDLR